MNKNLAILLFAVLMISTSSIFIRKAAEMPPLIIAFYRLFFATIILWGYVLSFKRKVLKISKPEMKLILYAAVFLSLHFALWITSLSYTSVASSVVFVTTSPLFVAIFSWMLKKDELTRPVMIGLFLTIGGSVLLAMADNSTAASMATAPRPLWGNFLALLGAVAIAWYYIFANMARKSVDALPCILYVTTVATVILAVIAYVQGASFTGYKHDTYFYVLLMSFFAQLFAHTVLNWSLKHVNTTVVAMATLTEPIFASILAWFILSEHIHPFKFIGMAIIITGLIVTVHQKNKSSKSIQKSINIH